MEATLIGNFLQLGFDFHGFVAWKCRSWLPKSVFYWLLIYIAGTGSMEIGASLGVVHGVGRAIPLILMSVLAILGINATKSLTVKRASIERASGWMLIVIGSFLIINGLPECHEWYEETFVHQGWNRLIEMTRIPSEFEMDSHEHEHSHFAHSLFIKNLYVVLLAGLITMPIFVYSVRKIREVTT